MNIVEICQYKYPGQIEAGNISFKMPMNEILISDWNVTDVPRPTEQELLAYGAEHELAIMINSLALDAAARIENLVNRAATQRDYKDAASCASYANSSNLKWQAEAKAFIEWRDLVWEYAYTELEKFKDGRWPIVTLDEFMSELPAIVWPE